MMGGIQPSEAKRLTYWEYTALRSIWNARQKAEDGDDEKMQPPSEELVRQRQAELAELGISGTGQ